MERFWKVGMCKFGGPATLDKWIENKTEGRAMAGECCNCGDEKVIGMKGILQDD